MGIINYIRNRSRYLQVALFLLLVLAGAGLTYKVYADSGYTISGKMTYGATPLTSQAYVNFKTSDNTGGVASADANGNYSLSGVPDGSYGATINADGDGKTSPTAISNIKSSNYPLTVNGADVTQNMALNQATVTVTVKDGNGNPAPGAEVLLNSVAGSTFTDASGAFQFNATRSGQIYDDVTTDSSGAVGVAAIPGVQYTLCASIGSVEHCASNITVNSDTTAEVDFPPSNTPPTITSAASKIVNAREVLNFTVTTTGTPKPALTESGSLPTGVTFTDNGDGTATFAGQPSPVNQGYYFITITASNSAGTASQSFILTVNNAQTVPTFVNASSTSASHGTPFSFTIDTTGNPIPTISRDASSGSLPPGVTLKDNKDGTATLSGTVTKASAIGTYNFTIKAKNKNGTGTQAFTLTIT